MARFSTSPSKKAGVGLTRRRIMLSGAAALAQPFRPIRAAPPLSGTKVDFDVPRGACDCHVHLIGSQAAFPMAANRVYTPPEATPSELLELQRSLHFDRVVLVQPSVYGLDNAAMLDGLRRLGPARARGVAVVDPGAAAGTLDALKAAGVAGVRINLETAGQTDPSVARARLDAAVTVCAPRGWHIQLYTRSSVIAALANDLSNIPVPIVFDHFGGIQAGQGTSQSGFETLLGLLRAGKAYVKISAAYRATTAPAPYSDVMPFAKAIVAANPDRVVWGSDWPHTDAAKVLGRSATTIAPDLPIDDGLVLDQLAAWVRDRTVRRKILVDNAARLYGFNP
jgi:predicted TIM-barrel fold metal-dependent hydrolase